MRKKVIKIKIYSPKKFEQDMAADESRLSIMAHHHAQYTLGGFIMLHEHARRRQDFPAEKRLNLACSVQVGIPSLSRSAKG
jgi:hypothetical protein